MDQCRQRLQLALEDADEERIMIEKDAIAAAEVAAMVARAALQAEQFGYRRWCLKSL